MKINVVLKDEGFGNNVYQVSGQSISCYVVCTKEVIDKLTFFTTRHEATKSLSECNVKAWKALKQGGGESDEKNENQRQ